MCHPAGALPSDWLPPSLIFKVYPLCHHNTGLKLYFYLAFINNPDCPQQAPYQIIVKFFFQVICLSHVTFHILHSLVIGLRQLPFPDNLGPFLLQFFDLICYDTIFLIKHFIRKLGFRTVFDELHHLFLKFLYPAIVLRGFCCRRISRTRSLSCSRQPSLQDPDTSSWYRTTLPPKPESLHTLPHNNRFSLYQKHLYTSFLLFQTATSQTQAYQIPHPLLTQ